MSFSDIINNLPLLWLLFGIILIIVETFVAPGIGLLFAGVSAILTGGAILSNFIEPTNYIIQTSIFLLLVILTSVIFWRPLKNLQKHTGQYNNIIGSNALIFEADLKRGTTGKVKWSGTIMNAVIDPSESENIIKVDSTVIIVSIDGNILSVKNLSN